MYHKTKIVAVIPAPAGYSSLQSLLEKYHTDPNKYQAISNKVKARYTG